MVRERWRSAIAGCFHTAYVPDRRLGQLLKQWGGDEPLDFSEQDRSVDGCLCLRCMQQSGFIQTVLLRQNQLCVVSILAGTACWHKVTLKETSMADTALTQQPFFRHKEKRPESEKRVHVLGEEMGPEELKEALQVGWLKWACVPGQDSVCMFKGPLLPHCYPGLHLQLDMSITHHPMELVAVRLRHNAWTAAV